MKALLTVEGIPTWVPFARLLGEAAWNPMPCEDGTIAVEACLEPKEAALVCARVRGVGLGGRLLRATTVPELPRALVRAARTEDARARRDTTPGFVRPGTRTDAEGGISLTPEALALEIGRRAEGLSVVDFCCGVGGNAIGFARAGCAVTAIDRHRGRLELARHNARVYGVEEQIRFACGDAMALATSFSGDIGFIDPPWGVDWNRSRTALDEFPLLTGLLGIAPHSCRELWAKVPPSFDPSTTPNAVPEAWFGEAPGDRHRVKFVLLRFSAEDRERSDTAHNRARSDRRDT